MGATASLVHDVWRANLPDEVRFWDDYVRTRGLDWPDEFRMRIDPDSPLTEAEILKRLPRTDPVRILDVGAGPMTALGKRIDGRGVAITAVDPLAEEYAAILGRYGVTPPVPTQPCEGERLSSCFDSNSFDVAYARNALDHTHDPRLVILEMLKVVKPGGHVILRHRPNEAAGASYAGLHQWNFDLRGHQFWIWNEYWRYNMHAVLAARAAIACHRDGEWLVCVLRKRGPASRAVCLLPALVGKIARNARRAAAAAFRRR